MDHTELKKRLIVLENRLITKGYYKDIITLVQRSLILETLDKRESLIFSAEIGEMKFVRYFFDQNDKIAVERALMGAIRYFQIEVIVFLLENNVGPVIPEILNYGLSVAIKVCRNDMAEIFLAHGAVGEDLLDYVARTDNLEGLKMLEQHGIDIFKDKLVFERSLLDGSFKILDYVVEKSKDIRIRGILIYTIMAQGNLRALKKLLDLGVSVHYEEDFFLSEAVVVGNLQIVEYLLSCGADVNAREGEPLTAALSKDKKIVQSLVKAGAEVTGDILTFAFFDSDLETIEFLIEHSKHILSLKAECITTLIHRGFSSPVIHLINVLEDRLKFEDSLAILQALFTKDHRLKEEEVWKVTSLVVKTKGIKEASKVELTSLIKWALTINNKTLLTILKVIS